MSVCRTCRAPVIWGVTEEGHRMPVDVEPVPDGNVVVDDRPGRSPLVTVVPPGALLIDEPPRYVSHFSTCPQADQHRRTS